MYSKGMIGTWQDKLPFVCCIHVLHCTAMPNCAPYRDMNGDPVLLLMTCDARLILVLDLLICAHVSR